MLIIPNQQLLLTGVISIVTRATKSGLTQGKAARKTERLSGLINFAAFTAANAG